MARPKVGSPHLKKSPAQMLKRASTAVAETPSTKESASASTFKTAVVKTMEMPPDSADNQSGQSSQGSGETVADVMTMELADKMIDAVKYAIDLWRLSAGFRDLRIHAVNAIGTPGCLEGPELEPLIKTAPAVAALTGDAKKIRNAVAAGVSDCFHDWQSMVTVPGLPWYPAFAAWPGPEAKPMPNVPCALISCVSSRVTDIVLPGPFETAMLDALPDNMQVPAVEAAFKKIALCLGIAFTHWIASSQVTLVMGYGPVPSFAPPYVPAGPVVGGTVIATPHLVSAAPLSLTIKPSLMTDL